MINNNIFKILEGFNNPEVNVSNSNNAQEELPQTKIPERKIRLDLFDNKSLTSVLVDQFAGCRTEQFQSSVFHQLPKIHSPDM